ncbi:hypothetical protein E2542_SST09274 [Spatholobus suberectus]|nr:hypothetical protein E2542_SST09274 [Spatholobus suberectus]
MLRQPSERDFKGQARSEKPKPILESNKEEPGWPSLRQLVVDLPKFSLEALTSSFFQFIPSRLKSESTKRGLTPLKNRLKMPEVEVEPPLVDRQSACASSLTENKQVHTPSTGRETFRNETPEDKIKHFQGSLFVEQAPFIKKTGVC